ncbi:hypothetical protein [Risungbinella massiliensis]|uniref:hypothetical protein n=1 Tax=Risungbinella massiliensis TaxID=1329796 RepID=UPI0012B60E40|nr:hypothetical protein [Risungbinella massiliensis]
MMLGIYIVLIALAIFFHKISKHYDAKRDDERAWDYFRYAIYSAGFAVVIALIQLTT